MFVPLLVDDLANEFAWSRYGSSRPEYCSDLASDVQTNCLQCVEGDGNQLRVVDAISGSVTYSDLPSLTLPGGINPTSFIFTMISISVLFQAIAFITVGSLGDYGNYRKRGLVYASTIGAIACCLFILLPISASMYWVGGLLIMISNVSLGVSVVFYNSYLPLMVEDTAEVFAAVNAEKQGLLEQGAVASEKSQGSAHKAREAANSEISSKGMMWGFVGFFTKEIGLRKPIELYILGVWFGACLGSAQAFGRAVFSELIPKGHEADMFALFEITDKGSSWLGPLISAVVVQTTGRIRPVLLYLLLAMVLPGGMLHFLDLTQSIKAAKGDVVGDEDEEREDESAVLTGSA